ncbi:hypothetical protein [Pseudomonas sp. ES3]|jgi:filamentous hemagglutinin|uniref:endonuclease toxin domain-containing protein n=1 Tax=Pseudomonas sp. ES3 TaxID=3424776 RepID=UPI003D32E255
MANPSSVFSSLKRNIDAAFNFTEYSLKDVTLTARSIHARELQVAILESTATAQWEQINKAIQYGASKGVTVKISTVK